VNARRLSPPDVNASRDTASTAPAKVPDHVLDECEESFTAADEKRQKASTQFFSDTGLMALLCRHDRVLWLVNMTSPGEKQHYALTLLNHLFDHLPTAMTIGVLYDIGCQLHRSCLKWGFLGDQLKRVTFAISVFHAYGHQWPCQLVYHPRKCPGFGLTDGEGCERFWSSLKPLIPSLRVSGVGFSIRF
jgi:Kyakuja-Dileera-Zisupton transposase